MQIQLSDHFTYGRLLRFALPSILMMLFTSIYIVVDGLFVSNVVGESAFASINLIMPYCMIFSSIGSVFGVGESDELQSLFKKSIVIIAVCSVSLTSVALLSAGGIASIFASYDEQFLQITTRALRMYSLSYFFAGINIFGANLFAALNDGLTAGILSTLRLFVFQLIAVFVLPLFFGSDGIWMSIFVAECCVLVITVTALARGRKKYKYA